MAFEFIPSSDPKQVLRMRRFMMALASYAMWVVLGLVGYYFNILSMPAMLVVISISGVVLSNLIFYLLLRTGANLRFEDPSMTLAQCAVAMFWILVLMISSPESRDVMLMVYIVTMLFGIFQLNRNEFLVLSAFAIFGYVAVILGDHSLRTNPPLMAKELLRFAVLTTMIIWSAFFGVYVSRLKQRLRTQNAKLQRAFNTANNQAQRDELTRTYNRRYIMNSLEQEKVVADEENRTFSVAILDLDHFKKVNDTYGHLAGDLVLSEFTQRASGVLRSMDQVRRRGHPIGRYGGEEFIVMLSGTSLPGAERCAERIRNLTEERLFTGDIPVTVSVGVAQYRSGEEIKDTIKRADQALYEAKTLGRNRVQTEMRSDNSPQGSDTICEHVMFDRVLKNS